MNWLRDRGRVLKNTFGSKKKVWEYVVKVLAVIGAISGFTDVFGILLPECQFTAPLWV